MALKPLALGRRSTTPKLLPKPAPCPAPRPVPKLGRLPGSKPPPNPMPPKPAPPEPEPNPPAPTPPAPKPPPGPAPCPPKPAPPGATLGLAMLLSTTLAPLGLAPRLLMTGVLAGLSLLTITSGVELMGAGPGSGAPRGRGGGRDLWRQVVGFKARHGATR